jgi:hypothetical protein
MEKYVFDGNEHFGLDIFAVSDKRYDTGRCNVKAVIYDNRMNKLHEQEGTVGLGVDLSVKAFKLDWRVPKDYLKRVFFLYLELKKGDKLLAENLYWIGTSGYVRPEKIIDVCAGWKNQVGKKKSNANWKDAVIPSYWSKPHKPPEKGSSVFYMNQVDIPAGWRGTKLEVFCSGFEGNDEVYWNGRKIGKTEEEVISLKHVRADEVFSADIIKAKKKGKVVNIRTNADPVVVPNLIKRFYVIPDKIVKWGKKNTIEIRLYGEHATGISEPVFVREISGEKQKKEVVDFDNKGAYLADMRNLPKVDLDTQVFCNSLTIGRNNKAEIKVCIKNSGKNLAFFVNLKLKGLNGEASVHYSDNYFALLPGGERTVTVGLVNDKIIKGSIRKSIQFEIDGWNVRNKKVGKKLGITLKHT